ncbi:hypothetical protein F4808DRAFT_435074 [Astrocystis sublimbata]|nr:hypothetical protein F4808DRAFT_435074 [Astrocystis sublimbata]
MRYDVTTTWGIHLPTPTSATQYRTGDRYIIAWKDQGRQCGCLICYLHVPTSPPCPSDLDPMSPQLIRCVRCVTAAKQLQLHPIRHLPRQSLSLPTVSLVCSCTQLRALPTPRGSLVPQRLHLPRSFRSHNFATTSAANMASDEDYMAFLDKANQDPSEGRAKTQGKGNDEFKATDEGTKVPAAIQKAIKDAFYVSDADEPFVPVCLAWDEAGKGLPDEEEFTTLIHHPAPPKAEIEIRDPADWDTRGQYKEIIDAVTQAGKGNDVRVYRVAKGGVRVEYWVVTTDGKGTDAKLVGAKALAVES